MFNGKMKAVTFSYDDAVTQDQRLIAMLDKYGLKCTFNLNSGLLGTHNSLIRGAVTVAHCKPRACEVEKIYRGHEVAAHTLTHPALTKQTDEEVIRQVEQDRIALSEIVGYEVVGMAYPGGGGTLYDDRVVELIRQHTGIRYARIVTSTWNTELQTDLLRFRPTAHHTEGWAKLYRLASDFVLSEPETPQLLYIWGHAYEFDIDNSWDDFELLCRILAGKDDIFYGTNRQVILGE